MFATFHCLLLPPLSYGGTWRARWAKNSSGSSDWLAPWPLGRQTVSAPSIRSFGLSRMEEAKQSLILFSSSFFFHLTIQQSSMVRRMSSLVQFLHVPPHVLSECCTGCLAAQTEKTQTPNIYLMVFGLLLAHLFRSMHLFFLYLGHNDLIPANCSVLYVDCLSKIMSFYFCGLWYFSLYYFRPCKHPLAHALVRA